MTISDYSLVVAEKSYRTAKLIVWEIYCTGDVYCTGGGHSYGVPVQSKGVLTQLASEERKYRYGSTSKAQVALKLLIFSLYIRPHQYSMATVGELCKLLRLK